MSFENKRELVVTSQSNFSAEYSGTILSLEVVTISVLYDDIVHKIMLTFLNFFGCFYSQCLVV